MNARWKSLAFADAPFQIIDGDRGSNYPKQSDYLDVGYCLFLNTGNVTKSGFDFGTLQFVDQAKDNALRKGKLTRDDIVMTTRGTIGNVAHYHADVPFDTMRINSGMVILRCDQHRLSPQFLFHFLRSPSFLGQTNSLRSGAAQPQLPIRDIKQIQMPLPSKDEQLRIAETLSAYDDLMENNRRRMAMLEESARLLYREWFVRLRFPGHEHARITNGIPEGWERKTLGECTSFLKRGIAPHYDDDAEGLVINQKCIRDGRLNVNLARRQSREFVTDRQVQVGDVLVNSTGEGTLGRVAQVKAPFGNCTVDTHVTIVRPKPEIPIHYFGTAVMAWESQFSTMGRGATNQTELSPGQIGESPILLPSRSLTGEFEAFAGPISDQVTNLDSQNQKLRAARDLLLPKLMSGEISV